MRSFFSKDSNKDSNNVATLAKQTFDACNKECDRLEKIQAKHIREAFLTWTQNLLAVKKAEEAAAVKRLKADGTTPGYITHKKNDYAQDKAKIQEAIQAIKNHKTAALGSSLIDELTSASSPLASARINGLQFADTKRFVKECRRAFAKKYGKNPDSMTLTKKILLIESLKSSAENEKDPLKMETALDDFLKRSKTVMNTRRDKSRSSFWGVIDRILKSLNRASSTTGIKSAQFTKHLDHLLFKATKKTILQTAKVDAEANKSKSRQPRV